MYTESGSNIEHKNVSTMKRYILLLAVTLGIALTGFAQKEKEEKSIVPPAVAKASFEKQFTGVTKVKWEKEGADYEVNFVQNAKEMSAVYDAKGAWKETESEITASELPAAAIEYIKQHYKNAKIREVAKITKAVHGEVNYEAAINGTDVIFDANGKFIKTVKD
jgi:hypothetical protein